MKNIVLNKIYELDLSGSHPITVIPIRFLEKGVLCEYLYSYEGRTEILGYEMFEMNGFNISDKPDTTVVDEKEQRYLIAKKYIDVYLEMVGMNMFVETPICYKALKIAAGIE